MYGSQEFREHSDSCPDGDAEARDLGKCRVRQISNHTISQVVSLIFEGNLCASKCGAYNSRLKLYFCYKVKVRRS